MGHFGGSYDLAVGLCYLFLSILGENAYKYGNIAKYLCMQIPASLKSVYILEVQFSFVRDIFTFFYTYVTDCTLCSVYKGLAEHRANLKHYIREGDARK